MPNPKLGHNIVRIRDVVGIEQQELAKRVRISNAAVSLIESGKRDPSFDVLVRIRRALGVEWAGLLRGIE